MSQAAERYVQTCSHPRVKGGARALLKLLAERIPEGQTMTPPIGLEELAALIGYSEKTTRQGRDLLVAIGEIKVVDGGQGRMASYDLCCLAGARAGQPLPLPLLGVAAPRRPRGRAPAKPDLFDHAEATTSPASDQTTKNFGSFYRSYVRANFGNFGNFGNFYRSTRANIGSFYRSTLANFGNFGSFYRSWVRELYIRARTSSKYVLTEEEGSPSPSGPSYVLQKPHRETFARDVATFVEWWSATYPAHNAGVLSLVEHRDGDVVAELLARGYTLGRLQAMALVLWALVTDGRAGSDRHWIAEVVTVRSIRVLRRKAEFLDQEVIRQAAAAAQVDGQRQEALRARESRAAGVRDALETEALVAEVWSLAGEVTQRALRDAAFGELKHQGMFQRMTPEVRDQTIDRLARNRLHEQFPTREALVAECRRLLRRQA